MAKKSVAAKSEPALFSTEQYLNSSGIGDIEKQSYDPYWDELDQEAELDRLIPANAKIGTFIVEKANNFLSLGLIINTNDLGFFVDWLNFGESSKNVNYLCGKNCFYNWERSEWSISKLAVAPDSLINKFLAVTPDFTVRSYLETVNEELNSKILAGTPVKEISLKNEDRDFQVSDKLRFTIGDRLISNHPFTKGEVVVKEYPHVDANNQHCFDWIVSTDNQLIHCSYLFAVGESIYSQQLQRSGEVVKIGKSGFSIEWQGWVKVPYSFSQIAELQLSKVEESKSCSNTLHSLPESVDLNSELKPQEQGELLPLNSLLKTTTKPNESSVTDSPESNNIQTLETGNQNQDNSISTQSDFPVQVHQSLVTAQDLNTQNQVCGSMPSERSPKENLISLLLKTPQDLSTTDLEQFLEDSEWLAISGKIRKSYQQRNLERPTKEKDCLSLPTPTTYPKGSGKCRPAGTNRLEQKLRPHIQKGDKLHPAVPGWMMGFPVGWVERVLADTGDLLSVQPPLIQVQATTSTTAATVLISTDEQLHPNKPALPLNELSILQNSQELLTPTNTDKQTTTQAVTEQGEVSTILTTPTIQVERGQDVENRGETSTSTITKIKALTLHQPWASLVGKFKNYETRGKATNYRGKIAIHAAVKQKDTGYWLGEFADLSKDFLGENVPYGSVVAIADLTDCYLMTEEFISQQSELELRCGLWKVGRYAWKLENVVFLPEPIPARGMPGLWDIELPIISSQESGVRRQEAEGRRQKVNISPQSPVTCHLSPIKPNFKTGEYILNGRVGEIIEDSPGEYFTVKYAKNDLKCYFFGQDDELINQLVIAPPDLIEQFLKDNLVTELCRSAEPLIDPEVSLKKKIASGSLAPYLEHKKLKDGTIVSYPKVEGERDKFNHLHWRWGYYYEVKVDGEWKNRSIPTPAKIVPQVKIMIENHCSVEEIKAFILQCKNKKAGVTNT